MKNDTLIRTLAIVFLVTLYFAALTIIAVTTGNFDMMMPVGIFGGFLLAGSIWAITEL